MSELKKVKTCRKCKSKIGDDNWLIVSMSLQAEVLLPVNPKTGIPEEDPENITNGCTSAEEFINEMLTPNGKPKIMGCEHCIKEK